MTKMILKLFTLIICLVSLNFSVDSANKPGAQSNDNKASIIDLILIEKAKRKMSLLYKGKVIKTYKVALGFEPLGHKQQEGDGKTPEGIYSISYKNAGGQFHKALKVSYPNKKDQANARKLGISPGDFIMIHGLGKSFSWLGKTHVLKDWTLGCVAVTDAEIDEVYKLTPVGAKVEIRP